MSLRTENRGLKKLLHSFGFAACGIWQCVLREQNFRLQTVAAGVGIWLGFRFELSSSGWGILWLATGLVLGAELLNTAVEAAVDLVSPTCHPLAKLAKDCAAGGVLTAALASVATALCLFHSGERWMALWTELELLLSRFSGWLFLACLGVLLWLYVFVGPAFLCKGNQKGMGEPPSPLSGE